jgi:hypothetical protein
MQVLDAVHVLIGLVLGANAYLATGIIHQAESGRVRIEYRGAVGMAAQLNYPAGRAFRPCPAESIKRTSR